MELLKHVFQNVIGLQNARELQKYAINTNTTFIGIEFLDKYGGIIDWTSVQDLSIGVGGKSIKRQLKKVHRNIGYCPQFDALLDDMTTKEIIIMYCLLRGIELKRTYIIADYLSKKFDFHRHLNKKVKELSGGNKRKLSTVLSLIGDPPVLFLDEPTTGMDPVAKRYVWDTLCKLRTLGKTIVLTSLSMEECEALCTKLAIMVNGNFKYLSSTQHLKSKFTKGYMLTIKVRKLPKSAGQQHTDIRQIETFIYSREFPGSPVKGKAPGAAELLYR
ncbi:unnamed protein product [Psylliodes chrysocephalus]|uniref:ABC transporter domain-containing protein n=1 Tax=Psylliodes chrysocephalus TaxID=3402493 RepID=A0A9P0D1J8_9CUCU|nr:unnamed protein product [Psylliodes chrysocephala]